MATLLLLANDVRIAPWDDAESNSRPTISRARTRRLVVIANHHFDEVRLPKIPHALQKLGLVLGPVGRIAGFGPTYDARPGEPVPAT